jgi:transcription termination factor NusB
MKKGDIITDTNEIQIIWEYFENLYSSELENQEEIDKFLDTYGLSKLNQEDINNLNRSIMMKLGS